MSAVRTYEVDRERFVVHEYTSLDDFLSSSIAPSGIHIIAQEPEHLPIYLLNDYRGFDTTVVFFHAAVKGNFTLPMLTGHNVSAALPMNRVFISDPSLACGPGVGLAWFAGSKDQPLQSILEQVFNHLFENHPKSKRLVFFGPSGGGFAALYYSSRIPASVALAMNPQTGIGKYRPEAVERYLKGCFDKEWTPGDPLPVPDDVVTDVSRLYSSPVGNTVLYVQNSRDATHIDDHLEPFLASCDPRNDVLLLLEPWGEGHVPPPKETITHLLGMTCKSDLHGAAEGEGFKRPALGGRPQRERAYSQPQGLPAVPRRSFIHRFLKR